MNLLNSNQDRRQLVARVGIGDLSSWPLHPFLFAVYPVAALLASNIEEMPIQDAYRSGFAALIAAMLSLTVLSLIFRNRHRAALLTSLALILLASYGQLYSLLKPITLAGLPIGRHRYLLPAIGVALLFAVWVVLRFRNSSSITPTLNLVAVVAVAIPVIAIASNTIRASFLEPVGQAGSADMASPLDISGGTELPDVYYIVLDAYAREDVLEERFGFDNSELIDSLERRGFYVADSSESNYLRTLFSLTSSLNANHLADLEVDPLGSQFRRQLEEQLRDSLVRRQLESVGYTTIAVSSSFAPTEIVDADYYLVPNMANIEALRAQGAINGFESMLLTNSIGRLLLDYNTVRGVSAFSFIATQLNNAKQIRREIILSAFEHLGKVPAIAGPKFVFAHIVSPHYPYLFGAKGEIVNYPEPLTFVEKQVLPGEASWRGYRDQLIYINSQLLETIDAILESSADPPIILIQSDHGPATGLDWTDPREPYLTDRSSILNAFFVPERCTKYLYPDISPVNSFRAVFNCSFGSNFDMVPDQTYLDVGVPGGLEFVPLEDLVDE